MEISAICFFGKGDREIGLIVFSMEPLSADGESGGYFYTFLAFTPEENWQEFYPILRAMVGHWVGWKHDNPIGVPLPETLPPPGDG